MGFKIKYFKDIDSTNDEAKRSLSTIDDNLVIIADKQRKGRGRFSRNWISEENKGLYMTIALKISLKDELVRGLSLIGPCSVCKTLRDLNIDAKIKWPNDIIVNSKKISGILSEFVVSDNNKYLIIGIGFNISYNLSDFSYELQEKVTSLKIENLDYIRKDQIISGVLENLDYFYKNADYKNNLKEIVNYTKDNSILLGKEVRVIFNNKEEIYFAKDINENGELIVIDKNKKETSLLSGEVSVRGLKGYI